VIPLRVKLVGVLTAVVLVSGGLSLYQISHRGAPSFRRGGAFSVAPTPDTGAGSSSALSALPAEAPNRELTNPTSAVTSSTGALRTSQTTVTTSGPAAIPAATRAATPTTPAISGTRPGPEFPDRPALGTYTFAVDGEETATVFGTRRFPDRMTMGIHPGSELRADQLVVDTRFSDVHEEREVMGFRADGIYDDYIAGSISYGPVTQTAEGDFDPPVLLIPRHLAAGVTRVGVSDFKDSHGQAMNTVDWKVTVVGQEPVAAARGTVLAWKVQFEAKSRPGPRDMAHRKRTFWFDPARALWVKFTEQTHGERKLFSGTLTYDNHLTATLVDFTAS
jgi:hypothetical protein